MKKKNDNRAINQSKQEPMNEIDVELLPLPDAIKRLLGDITTLYFKAHGAHWNVVGPDFSEYHELFGEIFEDVYSSIDPFAEIVRKLGAKAPASLMEICMNRNLTDQEVMNNALALLQDLIVANNYVLDELEDIFDNATKNNQQGIANFTAERIDKHQYWRWQMNASIGVDVPNATIDLDEEPMETKNVKYNPDQPRDERGRFGSGGGGGGDGTGGATGHQNDSAPHPMVQKYERQLNEDKANLQEAADQYNNVINSNVAQVAGQINDAINADWATLEAQGLSEDQISQQINTAYGSAVNGASELEAALKEAGSGQTLANDPEKVNQLYEKLDSIHQDTLSTRGMTSSASSATNNINSATNEAARALNNINSAQALVQDSERTLEGIKETFKSDYTHNTKSFKATLIKVKDATDTAPFGEISALVSVFNNIDYVNDRVMPGAFQKSIDQYTTEGKSIPFVWSHQWNNPEAYIGKITEAKETSKGLQVKAELYNTQTAQHVRQLMKDGVVTQFSFAYDTIKEMKAKDGANELLELRILEAGPTLKGANPATEIIESKNIGAWKPTESTINNVENTDNAKPEEHNAKSEEQVNGMNSQTALAIVEVEIASL